jgi:TonB family protein
MSRQDLPRDAIPTIPITPQEAERLQRGDLFSVSEMIASRYRVRRVIGMGGMGAVYEVEDGHFDHEIVALKTILPQIHENSAAQKRFRREVLYARRVTHLNACRTYDVGFHAVTNSRGEQIGDVIFVTMEYLDGENLSARLDHEGPFSPSAALPIARQIVSGIAAAHAADVIHRDIKSANIILTKTAGIRAVVTDFGLARLNRPPGAGDTLTETGVMVGSPAYMAPEQIENSHITPATDVYGLGVVLFEMLTGHRPFEGSSALAIVARKLRESPPSPRRYKPALSQEWERIILKCLDTNPNKRYVDAAALLRDLDVLDANSRAQRLEPTLIIQHTPSTIKRSFIMPLLISLCLAAGTWATLEIIHRDRAIPLEAQKTPNNTTNTIKTFETRTNPISSTALDTQPPVAPTTTTVTDERNATSVAAPTVTAQSRSDAEKAIEGDENAPLNTKDQSEAPARDANGVYLRVPPGGTQPVELQRTIPKYTIEARRAGIEGRVVVRGIVRGDGSIDSLNILQDLQYGLGQSALDAVSQWRFKPATYRGQPIEVYYSVTVNYHLRQS